MKTSSACDVKLSRDEVMVSFSVRNDGNAEFGEEVRGELLGAVGYESLIQNVLPSSPRGL